MKKVKVKKYETSEDREREYWAVHDSAEVLDWSKAKKTVFPNLKPSHSSISLRLPRILLEELKMIANKKDVPYQSLMKVYLTERVEKELVTPSREGGKSVGFVLRETNRRKSSYSATRLFRLKPRHKALTGK